VSRARTRPPRLGIRANLAQFSVLVAVNALVGGMVGQERTVVPLLATRIFHLEAFTAALSFIVVFGAVKAVTNLLAGTLSDRLGRKPVLVAGWLVGLPVPLLVIWAPSWGWVVAANVLLGVNQGLTWSTTVIMKIDLAGPKRRGLAMGLNEAAGYGAVAATALATGLIAQHAGLRPEPFFLGLGYAGLGLGLSALMVRETRGHARLEAATHAPASGGLGQGLSPSRVFMITSFRERALSACSQAGLVNNLNDGMAWGLFPLLYAGRGLSVTAIGTLAAIYPAVWGFGQLLTGALSDRLGRKPLIAGGMLVQAGGIAIIAGTTGFGPWAAGSALLGVGTAMVYPTLLAAIGDVAHPSWRASAVGVYRLWRDGGYALGAILAGVLADRFGLTAAVWAIAALTAASGVVVAVRMFETHRPTSDALTPPDEAGTPDPRPVRGRDGRDSALRPARALGSGRAIAARPVDRDRLVGARRGAAKQQARAGLCWVDAGVAELRADVVGRQPAHDRGGDQQDLQDAADGLDGDGEEGGDEVVRPRKEEHEEDAQPGDTGRGPEGNVAGPVEQMMLAAVLGQANFDERPDGDQPEKQGGHHEPGKEQLGDGVAEDVEVPRRRQPQDAVEPAVVPVRLCWRGDRCRVVGPVLPDRVDLCEPAEQGEDSGGEQ
jgi:MFS family permease